MGWFANRIQENYNSHFNEFKSKEKVKFNIKRRDELYDSRNVENIKGIETKGEVRLRKLFEYLNKFDSLGYKRSKHQKYFHKAFVGACIKKILGDDYGSVLENVIQKYEINSTTSDIVVTTPRRFGKTTGLAQFVAAFILVMDGVEVSIYSTGKRASTKLIEKIRDFIVLLSGSKDTIERFSQGEILQIKGAHGRSNYIGSVSY
jgi:hypothetical protein